MTNDQSTALLFEISQAGRRCHRLPTCDVPERHGVCRFPRSAAAPPPLPEVGEIDLIRHFTNLSQRNMSIDTNFYPLGSCTMKYNPKRHERLARLPRIRRPASAAERRVRARGCCNCFAKCRTSSARSPASTPFAAAGRRGPRRTDRPVRRRRLLPRHREPTTAKARAHPGQRSRHQPGQRRHSPDSRPSTVKSNAQGLVDLDDLKAKLDDRTAVFMITNPNTLGLFDSADHADHRTAACRTAAWSISTAPT